MTGGAQGIGGATARKLAAEGAKVLIADIDEAAMAQNAARIREAGGTVETIVADVSQGEQNKRMVDAAVDHWGALHILVNNAYAGGREMHGSAVEVSEEHWNQGLAILMTALFLGVKHAVPVMEQSGGGAIVNLSSVHGLLMAPRKLVYEAGKSAVIGMTRQMAIDFGPLGIRVNAICPGHIVTERITAAVGGAPGRAALLRAAVPGAPHRRAGRHRQRDHLPLLGRGVVHHRAGAGGGWRADTAVAGRPGGQHGALPARAAGCVVAVLIASAALRSWG